MRSVVVIPARYGSTRFPGKPLAMIAGQMMIERVWRIAAHAVGAENVYIATDDQRIVAAVEPFAAQAVLTGSCENGTERVFEAITALGLRPEIVINLQGDAVLTPPSFITQLVDAMKSDSSCDYATPAVRLSLDQYQSVLKLKEKNPYSGTFVTFDRHRNALYFSKQMIPSVRYRSDDSLPIFKHIGIYAYRFAALAKYLTLEATTLELAEGLEQLRILEHGYKIKVVPVDFDDRSAWAVDAPADLREVEDIIAREGDIYGSPTALEVKKEITFGNGI